MSKEKVEERKKKAAEPEETEAKHVMTEAVKKEKGGEISEGANKVTEDAVEPGGRRAKELLDTPTEKIAVEVEVAEPLAEAADMDVVGEGETEEEMPDEAQEYIALTKGRKLLTDPENYLKHGVHIGLTYRTGNMRKFIYKVRGDRLSIFSLNSIDDRIRLAAKMLARFKKDEILVVGSRAYARRPVRKFAENAGVNYVAGRFRPGSFTNPREGNFREPKLILVADPIADKQAVREAARVGIPAIGVCDSNALTRNLDLIIPLNNKGKQSIALMFWLLTKQYLIETGEMKEKDELKEFYELFGEMVAAIRERDKKKS
ncbi:MAG: 30S ribosomal protein S2 [candidate division WOR-3 bacterium]